MLSNLKTQLQTLLNESIPKAYPSDVSLPPIEIEIPSDHKHGEFACNIALKSAKLLKKPPLELADTFLKLIQDSISASELKDKIQKIEVKKPGFINFYLSPEAVYEILYQIFDQQDRYGTANVGEGKKVQVEFVSANPTGPLSVAHARQAVVGDSLVNILNTLGFAAQKEYYVNDGGNQINILGESIRCRALELLGEEVEFPEDGYQGEYIKDIAKIFMDQKSVKDVESLNGIALDEIKDFGASYILDVIKKDLTDFGVSFDVWSFESKIAHLKSIEEVLAFLNEKNFLYEKDGALWFKSTEFKDDKDRVVKKSDGSFTYLTPDIVYHKDKFERGFDEVINIWGPDHHGYIPRIKAAAQALGKDHDALKVLIVQLATIYREGKAVSMSTRRGQYISLREVLDEVGADAARFFFLMRHIKVHLDFDLELAKKQTPENPVYYIQYAHARVFSINDKAKEAGIIEQKTDISLLKEVEEIELIKKLGDYPEMLKLCAKELDPYSLISYLQTLAAYFHKFYDKYRVVTDDKDLSAQRLALVNATRIVIANGLRLIGVSTPEKM